MIRVALNRLLGLALFGALALFAGWVAIEAAARLAGRERNLLPVDYRSWWQDMQNWDPSGALRTAIFVGVGLLGLALVLFEAWPRRRQRTVEIARADHGHVLLRTRTVAPYLRSRLAERAWIRSAAPRVRLHGRQAQVSDRPQAARPWDPEELADANSGLRADVERLGLEPQGVEISPRAPAGRGTSQVR